MTDDSIADSKPGIYLHPLMTACTCLGLHVTIVFCQILPFMKIAVQGQLKGASSYQVVIIYLFGWKKLSSLCDISKVYNEG